ncbi:MAG: tetratricopeptide repeat protein [Candidatus Cloacimonetes bacterium]|nr:tetratricopeptide repeat protein [Candidatus Cloacimonadota bacterium]
MRKIFFVTIALLLLTSITANEIEDFKFAIGLYSDNNFNLAKIELENFITRYPESGFINDAKFLFANILLNDQEYEDANKIYQYIIGNNLKPELRAELLLNSAQCYYFQKEHPEAKKRFSTFLKEFSKHSLGWKANYYCGKIASYENDHKTALKYLDRAAKQSSDNSIEAAKLEIYISQDDEKLIATSIRKLISEKDKDEFTYQGIVQYLYYELDHKNYTKVLSGDFDIIPGNSHYFDDYCLIKGITFFETEQYENSQQELKKNNSDRSLYYQALNLIELDKITDARAVLTQLQNSEIEEIKTNSFFYLAKIQDDLDKSNKMLEKFVSDNPGHSFLGTAYYQLGYNKFLQKNYDPAREYFQKSLDKESNKKNAENCLYLLAESNNLLHKKDEAFRLFSEYVLKYKDGEFIDEAMFKLGIYHFEIKNYPEAFIKFNRILTEFPDSEKVGMCYYYIADIYLFQMKYEIAKSNYEKALLGKVDKGFVWLRVANIYFLTGDHNKAYAALQNVAEEDKYILEKYRLKGNLEFARKEYTKALNSFTIAEENAKTKQELENILIRKAWTFYQLKRFDEATKIYNKLSISTDSPGKFVLLAASSAFSAENYLNAIELYKKYLENYPDNNDIHKAEIGIADSYYNLGNYQKAADRYKKLIHPNTKNEIMENALNGFEWACEQTDQIDFLTQIKELLNSDLLSGFKVKLYDRKMRYEYQKGMWQGAINSCLKIENILPSYQNIRDLKFLKSLALIKLEKFQQADRSFAELISEKRDAEILFEWGKLKLLLNDKNEGMKKMRKASMLSRNPEIWIQLLELENELNDEYFQNDYHKFREFAKGIERENAELLQIEWQIKQQNFAEIDNKIANLQKSKNKKIKAKAQFLKGFSLFEQNKFERAIPELLRVRYLFPEITDIRVKSEIIACRAYLKSGKMNEAKQLYDVIKDDLSKENKQKLSELLDKVGE